MPQIEHIVVLMMENHSFDNLLGMVPHRGPGPRGGVDGLTRAHGRVTELQPRPEREAVFAQHGQLALPAPAMPHARPGTPATSPGTTGATTASCAASGPIAMRFWDQNDLPFTYSLAEHFPIGERYFCSVLAPDLPQPPLPLLRHRLGDDRTDSATFSIPAANGTIFDRLDAHRIDWGIYYQDAPELADRPGLGHARAGSASSTSSPSSTPTPRPASCPSSPSSTPTTTPPRRRTRRTSRSARSSSPRSSTR